MTDEIKLHKDITRQSQAEALLRNELIIEAFDVTTRTYLDRLMATAITDQELRERLWHRIQALADVRKHLTTVISGGRLAQKEIDALEQRREMFDVKI